MLGFWSFAQWPPNYAGRRDSREEDGFSEQHPFLAVSNAEFSTNLLAMYYFPSILFFLLLCH